MLGPLFAITTGAAALVVTTDSPDALCPPLEQARAATQARVGEVEGGPYEARYVTVRDAESGVEQLRLVLTNASGKTLLERTIPLGPDGCKDASQAIALILERYFRGVPGARLAPQTTPEVSSRVTPARSPPSTPSTPEHSRAPKTSLPPPAAVGAYDRGPAEPSLSPTTLLSFLARGGAGVDHLGTPEVAIGAELSTASFWAIGIDGVFGLAPAAHADQGFELESTTHSLYASSLFLLGPYGSWSLGAGPWLGAQRQAIELRDDATVPQGDPTRWVFAVGAQAALRFTVANNVRLDLVPRLGTQLAGTRFAIVDTEGTQTEVLALPALTWDLTLNLGFLLTSGT